MTNAMIILMESVKLMEQGLIGTTGRTFTVQAEDGTEKVLQEPEAIHTFAHWKDLGFCVKKGEHAVAKFAIWKGAERTVKDENGNDTDEKTTRMFMKTACFFSAAQVEPWTGEKAPKAQKGARKAAGGRKTAVPAVPAVASAGYGSWLA